MNTPMQHAPALRPASTAPANTLGFPLTPLDAAPAKTSTFGLLDIWRILIKYRWLILASLLVGIAAAIATVGSANALRKVCSSGVESVASALGTTTSEAVGNHCRWCGRAHRRASRADRGLPVPGQSMRSPIRVHRMRVSQVKPWTVSGA